ncbi:MAG TPA: putative Ig domain-containing protein [Candidatus Acidoferrum sp.]|nr:putative Ig domain-containing protein [Candidatus Acidoferrum sp.]
MPVRLRTFFSTDGLTYSFFIILLALTVGLNGCAGLAGAPNTGGSLAISTAALPDGVVGAPYSETLQASGGTAPYSWDVMSGSLPAGVTLDPSSGTISGTPTATGTSSVTVEVTDAASHKAHRGWGWSVGSRLSITTSALPSGTVGAAYSATLQVSGGQSPYSWSMSSGSLPAGLSLNASSGVISGTPTASATSLFTVKVTDSGNNAASQALDIAIAAATPTLTVSTSTLAGGTVGTAYSTTLQATGGTTPYSWSTSSGSLPAGLSLNTSSGAITGTPTTSGTSTFTVKVTDASNNTATKSLSIAVAAATPTLTVSTSTLAGGTVGTAYSTTLQATGGTTPYSWSVSSGSLPAGLSLNTSSGAITGTPTTSGTSTFTVKVTDAANNTATKSLSIAVADVPLTITTTSLPNGSTNTAYSAFLYAGGGTTPYTWTVSSGSLPTGLSMTTGGDITGTPTAAGAFTFTAKVTDSSSPANTATASFTLTVTQGTAYSVSLTWVTSPSSGVAGYNVYRTTVSGSDYVRINSTVVTSLSYVDGTVQDGTTYYYVITAVDASGNESAYSPQCSMAIP